MNIWLDILAMYAMAAVVCAALAAFIYGVTRLLGAKPSASATGPLRVAAPSAAATIPPEHVVAIAAAIHAKRKTYRILKISATAGSRGWVDSTRLDHHRSHTLK